MEPPRWVPGGVCVQLPNRTAFCGVTAALYLMREMLQGAGRCSPNLTEMMLEMLQGAGRCSPNLTEHQGGRKSE